MSDFRRYDHVERLGRSAVYGIDLGEVYVFPKIDGTNASVWIEPIVHPELGVVDVDFCCGSRNRKLAEGKDNAGFHAWVHSDDPRAVAVRAFLCDNPGLTLYGEWLVPHSLKTYRDDSWRRFWVFDVYDREGDYYVHYDLYSKKLEQEGIDYIPPLCTINNPSAAQLYQELDANTFQIKDGEGAGEGIVLKNYHWRNERNRQPWAKIVRAEFKELNHKVFGPTKKEGPPLVEQDIVNRYVTKALVDKTRAKILRDEAERLGPPEGAGYTDDDWGEFEMANRAKIIPQLLSRVYYDVIHEDLWDAIKRHKNPVIDFKKLSGLTTRAIKQHAEDLF